MENVKKSLEQEKVRLENKIWMLTNSEKEMSDCELIAFTRGKLDEVKRVIKTVELEEECVKNEKAKKIKEVKIACFYLIVCMILILAWFGLINLFAGISR